VYDTLGHERDPCVYSSEPSETEGSDEGSAVIQITSNLSNICPSMGFQISAFAVSHPGQRRVPPLVSHVKPATTETFRDNCDAQNNGEGYTLYDTTLLASSHVIFCVEVHYRCFASSSVTLLQCQRAANSKHCRTGGADGTLLGASGRCHEGNKDNCGCTLTGVNL
jgi:hypothetical protein